MAKGAIEVKGLYKAFGKGPSRIEVLKGLDLHVSAGERVAVVGPSGAGKSTLLHILGTLDRPNAGKVYLFGEDVFSYSDQELSRFRNQKLGFVFQFHHLLPEFNALENVMLPALIAGISIPEAQKRAREILKQIGLASHLEHRVGELSGGERQRVAIARALVMKPSIILADEPTGNLDLYTSQEVANLLLHINRTYATTLVIVTHNPELAAKMERILGLVDGKIVELSPDEPWPWSQKRTSRSS